MSNLRRDNEELKKKVDLLTRIKDKFKRQLAELSGKVEEEKTKVWKQLTEERRTAFERHCRQKDRQLENKISELEESNATMKEEKAELENRRNELETMTVSQMDTIEELEEGMTKLSNKNTQLEEKRRALSTSYRELEEKYQHLEATLSTTITRCEQLERTSTQIEQARQKLDVESQKASKTITDLESLFQTSNEFNIRTSKENETVREENDTLRETSSRATHELNYHRSSLGNKDRELLALPSDWEVMADNLNCKMSPTDRDGKAFEMVSRRFMETMQGLQVKIIKVDRIQNKCLHKQYHLKKTQISQHSKSSNEKLLWHGTHGEAVTGITVNGFDRGYKGFNVGAIHGQGVYFSTSSKYSSNFSRSNINNEYHMFLARVLTGDSILGKSEDKVLPVKDHSNHTRYDSLINDESRPTIFVVMNDTQAYPEYLVTYTITGK